MRIILAGTALAGMAASAHAQSNDLVYAVTENQTLIRFNSNTPGTILGGVAISGLDANETIRGIDFRPATNQLYALGSFSNLYTINLVTGAASRVNAAPFSTPLSGSSFGFDFNPTIDRIRVVSDSNQNLVLNPITGAVQLNATPLFYKTGDANEGRDPNVLASAYNNNFAGAMTSQLFGLDTGLDILVKQANNTGVLDTVGSLGIDISDQAGFDISGVTGRAYASVQDRNLGQSTFWSIDLNTGQATMIGAIGGGSQVGAIAVIPAPGALAMLAAGGLIAGRRRR